MSTETFIDGSGFDFKIGAIVRPFEESPFRIGLAVHSPVFYDLTLSTNVIAVTYTPDSELQRVNTTIVDSYDYTRNLDYGYDFRLHTPWTYNLSAGYTVGSSFAIGAEYEFRDYSSMRFYYSDGDDMQWENSTVKEMLKGVHTFRIGGEWKILPQLSFRMGYNYISSAFEDSAYKDLPPNSIMTDTDFSNSRSTTNITTGLGYKYLGFYVDLAYLYNTNKADFYAFDDSALTKTSVTNHRNKFMVTLGYRF